MDRAALFDDLASPGLSLSEVAARHGLTIEALSIYLASDEAQATLDHIQSTLAIRTRLAAQIRLPIAIAALGTLLTSHRAAACAPPTASAPRDEARSPREEARALRHQIELRRAASTLLRFANFNHRALARAHPIDPARATTPRQRSHESQPRQPSVPSELSLTSEPRPAPAPPPRCRAQFADAYADPSLASASSPIPSSSPASPSLHPLSISSIPLPIPASPFPSHPDPSLASSSLFLRASVPRWFIPSSSPAANRLATAAGAASHPP